MKSDQVVDDPTNEFLAKVLEMWPKTNAVEMEGAGATAAIDQANCLGISTRFMMIQGDIRCGRCLHNGMDWDRLPRSPSAKSRVCDCLRNRSESSVFYSCRFSFSGLVAAKLAVVIGI